MITISGKALGRRKPLFEDFSVDPPEISEDGDGGTTLRDVITHVVIAEVKAWRKRRDRRKLDRVLSSAQITEGAARGKISPEGKDNEQDVDEDDAVGAALQAFEDGIYIVVLDGTEQRDLDAQVYLKPDSKLTFIRLTMLAGG